MAPTHEHRLSGVYEDIELPELQRESPVQASFRHERLSSYFNRPLAVPVYDPEASDIGTVFKGKTYYPRPDTTLHFPPGGPSHSRRYGVNQAEGSSIMTSSSIQQLPPRTRPSKPRSIISFTPSALPVVSPTQGLSNYQLEELRRITRHEKDRVRHNLPVQRQDEESEEPPDGGLLAWAHSVAGFFVCFNAQGLNLAFGIFQAYYEQVLLRDLSPSRIAWIGSFQSFALFFLGLIVGPLVAKGHFRICCTGGSILLCLAILGTSWCQTYWQLFWVQGVATGLSMGAVFTSGVIVLTSYFSTHLGIASAIAAAGSSMGGIIFPIVGKQLISKIGFGWTMRVIALINLCTMIPVNIIIRQRRGWKPNKSPGMDWTAFKDTPYMLMMAGMFFAFWGVYFGFYFIVTYGQVALKMSADSSINLLIAMNSANLIGRFLPNFISDACIGPLNTLIPTTFIASAMIFLWIGVSTPTSLFLVACFYGFAAAGIQSLYTTTIFSFVGSDRTKAGIRMGMVFAVIGLACLTGAPIGGALIAKRSDVGGEGSFLYAQLFAGIAIALGGLLFLTARIVKSGWVAGRV